MHAQGATSHQPFGVRAEDTAATGAKLKSAGLHITRYAIVLVLVWIGMKFTAYEAGAIERGGKEEYEKILFGKVGAR